MVRLRRTTCDESLLAVMLIGSVATMAQGPQAWNAKTIVWQEIYPDGTKYALLAPPSTVTIQIDAALTACAGLGLSGKTARWAFMREHQFVCKKNIRSAQPSSGRVKTVCDHIVAHSGGTRFTDLRFY